MKQKKTLTVLLILFSIVFNMFTFPSFGQTTLQCEQCGMNVDATGQARFRIIDADSGQHVACCPVCALRLIKTYGELNITSFCDYNGPTKPITILAKQNGSSLTVNPQTAQIILGGGCIKNRLVYDTSAADELLRPPNNGTSKWLSVLTNATVLSNATRLGIAQAVLQYGGGTNSVCEQCGMIVDVTGQARFKIFDTTGTLHIACCPICALRLQKIYGDLNITSFCDYNGPNYPITIMSKNNGIDVTVNPPGALIIAAGSCTKNRIVYNSTAADALLAPPNNGTSRWLSILSNDTVALNATRLPVAQAALINGAGVPSPSPSTSSSPTSSILPSASPTPTNTPALSATPSQFPEQSSYPSPEITSSQQPTTIPTTTQEPTSDVAYECEACGMDVTPESQSRYRVTDGNGNIHYVECFMCALALINDYETLRIETYCDWNGPNYPIIVTTSNYGSKVAVSPTTAMYLRGGSCVTARAAFDQAAAENLLSNGYSEHTSPEQRYQLPTNTEAKTIVDAINMWYSSPKEAENIISPIIVLMIIVGAVILSSTIFAYKKLKQK